MTFTFPSESAFTFAGISTSSRDFGTDRPHADGSPVAGVMIETLHHAIKTQKWKYTPSFKLPLPVQNQINRSYTTL